MRAVFLPSDQRISRWHLSAEAHSLLQRWVLAHLQVRHSPEPRRPALLALLHVLIKPCSSRAICGKPLTRRGRMLDVASPMSLIALRQLRPFASPIYLRMAPQNILTQAFLVVTDSVLMAQPAPAPMHVMVATRADSPVTVAMVLTAAPEETRAGTAALLATVATQKRVARIPPALVVQVDAQDVSATAAQAVQV